MKTPCLILQLSELTEVLSLPRLGHMVTRCPGESRMPFELMRRKKKKKSLGVGGGGGKCTLPVRMFEGMMLPDDTT